MKKIVKTNLFKITSIFTLFCFTLTLFPKPSFSQGVIMKIAVLNFENTNRDAKYDYLSTSIAESLSTFLIKYSKGKVIIVERSQIDKALKEVGFQMSGFTDEKTALQIGKLTNATHIIIGSYTVIEDVIRINARLISVEAGEGILAESITGKGGKETFNQINKLSAKIIESLTGEKVKIENFKDIQNPFQITITAPKKKNTLIWIILGVCAIGALIYSLTRQEQTVTQTVK